MPAETTPSPDANVAVDGRAARGTATREQLITVAERLFAIHGIQGTSTRRITADAGVNSDAIHYHFATKDALVAAILERRAQQLDERVLRLLHQVSARRPLTLHEVAQLFVQPVVEMQAAGTDYAGFLVALLADPKRRHLATVRSTAWTDHRLEALAPLTPQLDDAERMHRIAVAGFLVVHALTAGPIREWLALQAPAANEAAVPMLVDFLAGAFAGPAIEAERTG